MTGSNRLNAAGSPDDTIAWYHGDFPLGVPSESAQNIPYKNGFGLSSIPNPGKMKLYTF
jgi:hypothetical protein